MRNRRNTLSWFVVCTLLLTALAQPGWCAAAEQTLTLALDPPQLETSKSATSPQPNAKQAAASAADAPNKMPTVGRVGTVQAATATIYRSRSTTGGKFATVKADTPLAIVKEEGDWYGVLMVNGATGWIARSAVKMTSYELVSKKPIFDRSTAVSRGGAGSRPGSFGEALIQTALQYEGARYLFGGTDPNKGIDCSAFVRLVFSHYKISLPRTAREQALVGTTVPFDELKPGDRLYFSCKNSYVDHCGVYAGGGYFVHSSVTRGGVAVDSLASDFYWRSLVVAKRS